MASSEMSIKLYIFPLTKEENNQPNITGYPYIMKHQDRLIEAEELGYADFNLANYDKGRNLIVYNDVVYEIYKDYSDITNHKRYFLLKPILNGSEQM
jgi:hypothetical protein